jgi:hypothetical protein
MRSSTQNIRLARLTCGLDFSVPSATLHSRRPIAAKQLRVATDGLSSLPVDLRTTVVIDQVLSTLQQPHRVSVG